MSIYSDDYDYYDSEYADAILSGDDAFYDGTIDDDFDDSIISDDYDDDEMYIEEDGDSLLDDSQL